MKPERLEPHPIAKLFPPLPADEYEQLKQDIQERGVQVPLVLYEGKILDGLNRYRICTELGIDPPTKVWNPKDANELQAWLQAKCLNVLRRHLPADQRYAILKVAAGQFRAVNEQIETTKKEAAKREAAGVGADGSGGRGKKKTLGSRDPRVSRSADTIGVLAGVSAATVKRVDRLGRESPKKLKEVAAGKTSATKALRDINKEKRRKVQAQRAEMPTGRYQCIVADPPWPVTKIERDERPNQEGFDYPTMTVDEISALPIPAVAEEDCHLYLWTTHKFLPDALKIADTWGFRYQCLLTWVKNVGFTPFSWMYSTEHVLFCTRGNLELAVKGRRLDFQAKVREHSRKPDEFYSLVCEVTPGPRLELFSREHREGFVAFGNEPEKFGAA